MAKAYKTLHINQKTRDKLLAQWNQCATSYQLPQIEEFYVVLQKFLQTLCSSVNKAKMGCITGCCKLVFSSFKYWQERHLQQSMKA